jgi:peptidoglycan/xylan/chitin deacetylase (PgdA/CDA1 family)
MKRIVHIVLRFDDPSATSDHALEREILAILGELDLPATVAVVPFASSAEGLVPVTHDNVPHLVAAHAAGNIEVAQHGYAHQHMTSSPNGSPSEFWGVPADAQQRCIDAGRDQLKLTFGAQVRGFIPPWNTYDGITAHHLAARGYDYLSGSLVTPPDHKMSFCLIPCTCAVHQLRQAYAEARRHPFLSHTIVVIMHHYDFLEGTEQPGKLSLHAFRETLHWLKQQPGVQFITMERLAKNLGISGSHAVLRRHLKKERLHWRLQRLLPRTLLMTHPLWMYFKPVTQRPHERPLT